MNGRIHGEVKDPIDPPAAVNRKRLALLDGTNRYSLSLWRLPPGVPFDRVNLVTWPQEYLQVAGCRDGMTIEIRRFEGGAPRQYAAGRSISDRNDTNAETVIRWNGGETKVFSNEVFTVEEAADLFAIYLENADVPETHLLRPLSF